MLRSRLFHVTAVAGALALTGAAGMVAAQSSDQIDLNQPDDSSGTFEISGVKVDTSGPTADAARFAGWREAQRKGWQMLSAKMGRASTLPDGALDGMVAGIVIENEQIGPNRYIATLGVLFSRAKAAPILGVSGIGSRSLPMLTIPIQWSGGSAIGFEQKTAWADAWDRFRAGDSSVDYVRPGGNGPDSLLLNLGQTGRRDRAWWRAVLDQYGSQDVLVPSVTLYRQWPGGPVIGVFEARHGPDNQLLQRFALKVEGESGVPALLDAGVKRIDDIYQTAMRNGQLATDASLAYVPPVGATPTPTPTPDATAIDDLSGLDLGTTPTPGAATEITLQFDSPNSSAVSSTESSVRAIPGVSGAVTTSLAIGGVSVMRLDYSGDPEALRSALESRGYAAGRSGSTLRIRRNPSLPPPSVPADNSTAG
jgi:hypothetical protein